MHLPDGFTAVGEVLKAHGLRGGLKVLPLSWDRNRLAAVGHVHAWKSGEMRTLAIDDFRMLGDLWLLRFVEITSPEDAKDWAGTILCVPDDEVKRPEDGRWIHADLLGFAVRSEHGAPLGRVEDVVELPTCLALRIQSDEASPREVFIPLEGTDPPRVDWDGRSVVVLRALWDAMHPDQPE